MSLEKTLRELDKKFGEGLVFKLGENKALDVEALSTGFISLDKALGIGGLPKGRIVEVWGWEQAGKTTLVQHIIAEAQRQGGTCALVDMENALSKNWAKVCGVDTDNLYVSQPENGEIALSITEALIRSGEIDLVVVDSTNALVTRAEIEGDMADHHMGVQARLMSQALRKLSGPVKQNNAILIFISQVRQNIGTWASNSVGTGNSLKFYASVRMELVKTQSIKEATDVIGHKVSVRIKKNKVAAPFQECELRLYFDQGFSKEADLLLYAIDKGIVDKRGAWFTYEDTKLQGETNFVNFLRENVDVYEEIKNKVLSVE